METSPYHKLHLLRILVGIYLSKALTCMKIFLYEQELLFCQGDGYLWSHCCMNNLYISHRSLYAPTTSFWAIRSMFISLFRVTSWFDTVYNVVARWMNFRKKNNPQTNLLGKGWPLGSCWRCLLYFCYFRMWYPGSGVVLDCIVSLSLPPFLLWCGTIFVCAPFAVCVNLFWHPTSKVNLECPAICIQ